MFNGKFLNAKERKEIARVLKEQFGAEFKAEDVLLKTNKDKLYVVNEDISEIDFENLRVDKIGLYLGGLQADGFRLSIEGSEIIGPLASRNVIEVSYDDMLEWMRGKDLAYSGDEENALVIIKHKEYWLGCGKLRDGRILNFVPKTRRISDV
jgi:NOL1/NOP2/fmu family ribosome biogenesis protein